MKEKTKVVSVRLPLSLKAKLDSMSEVLGCSCNQLVVSLLKVGFAIADASERQMKGDGNGKI